MSTILSQWMGLALCEIADQNLGLGIKIVSDDIEVALIVEIENG